MKRMVVLWLYQSLRLVYQDIQCLGIPKVNKILLGITGQFQDELKEMLDKQYKFSYFFYGEDYNSPYYYYVSNHLYYYHLKNDSPFILCSWIFKKLHKVLYIQDFGSKSFYVTLIGKYRENYTDNLRSEITKLPYGSAISIIGHDTNQITSSTLYKKIVLKRFEFDSDNIYIDFFYSIILTPYDHVLLINGQNTVNRFSVYISELKSNLDDIWSWQLLKIKQYSNFINEIGRHVTSEEIIAAIRFLENYNRDPYFFDELFKNFNHKEHYNNILLFNSILSSDALETTKQILKPIQSNIADISIYDFKLIHIAAKSENNKFLRYLLEKKIDPNTQIYNQITALHVAAKESNIINAEILLKHGANPNICNAYKETPLSIAMSKNDTKLSILLLDNGATTSCQNEEGYFPFIIEDEI